MSIPAVVLGFDEALNPVEEDLAAPVATPLQMRDLVCCQAPAVRRPVVAVSTRTSSCSPSELPSPG
jgi:hypothetical protein